MSNGENHSMVVTSLFVEKARFLIVMTVSITVLLVAASLLLPRVYRAESKLVPSSRFQSTGGLNLPSALIGASNFMGLNLGGSGSDLSQLFSQIIRDPDFTRMILDKEFVNQHSQKVTLANYMMSDFDRSEHAYLKLSKTFNRRILKIGINDRSGVTSLGIEMKDPHMARDVANYCVEELDRFHRDILNTQSEQLVSFLDERLGLSSSQLEEAENVLEDFYKNNRVIHGAPHLEIQQGRLLRDIQLKNEIFLSLSGQLEMARIEMFKNMPTIVVLNNAVIPLKPYKPNRSLVFFLSFIFAFFFSFLVVLVQIGKQRWDNYTRESNV